jgi:transposase, IS6 family
MLKRVRRSRRVHPVLPPRSAFAGFRFPREVIVLAVRWYLRYGLSYRDVEELLVERGVQVDHVSIYRWVQRFTPLLIDAARPRRHATGDRWFVDETYVKVAGQWVYLYRAIDQFGQVIDVLVSQKRDLAATRRFFTHALEHGPRPSEVSTDQAPAYPRVVAELLPAACHVLEQYATDRSNPIMDGSNPGCGRCGASNGSARPASSAPDTHSSKTSAAATTNSAWTTSTPDTGSPRPLPSSHSPSEQDVSSVERVLPPANATAPCQALHRGEVRLSRSIGPPRRLSVAVAEA